MQDDSQWRPPTDSGDSGDSGDETARDDGGHPTRSDASIDVPDDVWRPRGDQASAVANPDPVFPAPGGAAQATPDPVFPAPGSAAQATSGSALPAPGSPAQASPAPALPTPTVPQRSSVEHPASVHSTTAAPWPSDVTVVTGPSLPSSGRSKRSRWLVGGAVAAVVAVGTAGVFAIGGLTSDEQGGGDTPEALGLALMEAIEAEDVLGMIDVLVPGERTVLGDPLIDFVAELTRLGVLSPDADLAAIAGIDVELSNESVRSMPTNVADITNVAMTADAIVTFEGAKVPLGSLLADNLPDGAMTDLRSTSVTETEQFDVTMTAVEHDGRWYFSVFHTAAEAARTDLAAGSAIPAEGIGTDGADTPEAAVDGLLDAVQALDLTGLLRRLNPGEAAALQRYAPLFLDDAVAELDALPLDWTITTREFRIEGDGDMRTVLVDALAIEGTFEGTVFSVGFADGCVRAQAEGESFEQCEGQGSTADLDDLLADSPETERLLELITEAFADIEPVGLELRRFDGAWYVSPTSTVAEGLLAVLRSLDRSEIDAIVEQAPAAIEEFSDAIFNGLGTLAEEFGGSDGEFTDGAIDDEFIDDEFTDEFMDDEFTDDGGLAVGDVDPLDAAWAECYTENDATAATTCFETVTSNGGPDQSQMPVQLRFPECGDTSLWGTFYELPDEEFIAAAESARPCFLDLVERGAVESWELPDEITHLECFEGRNWYKVFDDPEYDDRHFACVGGS